ncbi:hypothetical protein HK098_007242 [Nowakowskiella sp. JEL0407]|nr:hypothetical protein HK098_007242 [Nowakowskiella sp. JEL0407]
MSCSQCFPGNIPNGNRDASKSHFYLTSTSPSSACSCSALCNTYSQCELSIFEGGICYLTASDSYDGWQTGFLASTVVLNDFHLNSNGQNVNDITKSGISGISSLSSCRTQCSLNSQCDFFGYNQGLQMCYLKRFSSGGTMCIGTDTSSPRPSSPVIVSPPATSTSPDIRVTGNSNGSGSALVNGDNGTGNGNGGLSTGVIGGIVAAIGVLFLAVGIGLGIFFARRRPREDTRQRSLDGAVMLPAVPPSQTSSGTGYSSNTSGASYQPVPAFVPYQEEVVMLYGVPPTDNRYIPASQVSPYFPNAPLVPSPNPANEYRESWYSGASGATGSGSSLNGNSANLVMVQGTNP